MQSIDWTERTMQARKNEREVKLSATKPYTVNGIFEPHTPKFEPRYHVIS